MLRWLRRRRETAERIEAEAEAVMRAYAARAYAEARRREREAKTNAEAQNWNRVALSIAHKMGKRVGFDTATRMAADANFASGPESSLRVRIPQFQTSTRWTSLSAWSPKTPDGDTASRFSVREPTRGRRSCKRSKCALLTCRVHCAKRPKRPGRHERSNFGWSTMMDARSSEDRKAIASREWWRCVYAVTCTDDHSS